MDGAHHRARAPLAQVLQGAHQRQGSGGVKTGRRLIQKEQFRPGEQFHRHAQTLSLTTWDAFVTGITYNNVAAVFDTHRLQRLIHTKFSFVQRCSFG